MNGSSSRKAGSLVFPYVLRDTSENHPFLGSLHDPARYPRASRDGSGIIWRGSTCCGKRRCSIVILSESEESPHYETLRFAQDDGNGASPTFRPSVCDGSGPRDAGRKIVFHALAATMPRPKACPGLIFSGRNVTPCQTRRLCPPDAFRLPVSGG